MEGRISHSDLLSDSVKSNPNASGWLTDNVWHPFVNGTGLPQIYNNFVKEENKLAPAYVPEVKTLSSDWVVHTLSSAAGAVLVYGLVGKATNMGLSQIATSAGLEGTAAKALTSLATANIVGAGLYDLAKVPNPGETRLGNAAGSLAAFGVFAGGNHLLQSSAAFANSNTMMAIGRIGVGMAGGLTSLETSHMISRALGEKNELNWSDRFNSMAGGGFINVAMPVVQKGISTVVDKALHPKPLNIEPIETKALLEATGTMPKPDVLPQKGLGIAGRLNLPEKLEINNVARGRGGAQTGDMPETILLKQQFDEPARHKQMQMVADEFAKFVGDAKKTVESAVYSFRMNDPRTENTIINAFNKLADNGVEVRIAFFDPPEVKAGDANRFANIAKSTGGSTPEMVYGKGGASPEFLQKLNPKIQIQRMGPTGGENSGIPADPLSAITGDKGGAAPAGAGKKLVDFQQGKTGNLDTGNVGMHAIDGDGHLQHNKYVVVDAGTKNAKVWTGSTNFTDDAFANQDNNIIIIRNQKIADTFSKNFNQMWDAGTLTGTGANLHTTVKMGEGSMTVAFSPGDGAFIDAEFAKRFANAKESVHIASMVISSPQMLQALVDDINRGIKVTGIYDGPQMDQVERNWSKFKTSAEKLKMWNEVKQHLVRKESHPYTPDGIHDFQHNKMYVVDGKNAGTGSFNFSKNATMNAENVVMMDDAPTIAKRYTNYIDDLVKTYEGKGLQGEPIVAKPPMPQMNAEQAHTKFKQMVADGKIPPGKFVDSVSKQNYPLTPRQLEVVMKILTENWGK